MTPKLTHGSDFAALTTYLVEAREHTVLHIRGVSSIDNAADEMRSVAAQSHRVRKPVMHVSFSAAPDDGLLTTSLWLLLVDAAEKEFGLGGHQRIVVRHHDKDHDHIHVFWCTVSEETGRTPPRQWFRSRSAQCPELDQHALDDVQCARIGEEGVVQGPFNRFALARLMMVCRTFERVHDLRCLRDRKDAAAARKRGEPRPARSTDRHREERTGRPSLAGRADVIREALDRRSWTDARLALNTAGIDLKPLVRVGKEGVEEYRGLTLVDLGDPGNRLPASFFDLPDRRYGLRHVERRHEAGAPTIEAWWPTRGEPDATPTGSRNASTLRAEYDRLVAEHRLQEAERSARRDRLASKHAEERRRRRRRLMLLRSLRAARLPIAERRDFYATFSRTTRTIIWKALERRQAAERLSLRRRPLPTWQVFLASHASDPLTRTEKTAPSPTITYRPERPRHDDDPHTPAPVTPETNFDEAADIDVGLFVAWRDGRGR